MSGILIWYRSGRPPGDAQRAGEHTPGAGGRAPGDDDSAAPPRGTRTGVRTDLGDPRLLRLRTNVIRRQA